MGDIRRAILATNAVLIVLSLAAIACRVGRRIILFRGSNWHDALIALAAMSATIFSILQMVSTSFGEGLSNDQISAPNIKIVYQIVMASRIFYFTCNWAVKHSLLLFYATITTDKWPRRSIYFMHIIAFAFGTTCILLTIFQCAPISKMWNGPDDATIPGHCINMDSFNYFNSCFMLATDIILYTMPLVFTRHLTISRAQRIAISLLFALGGLVLAASGARVYFVHTQATRPDLTGSFATTMLCAVIENHVAIIVACAPAIKAILLHTFPSLAVKFENFVNKPSPSASVFMSSDISTIVVGIETAGKEGVKWEGRKWWNAPSVWEVNSEVEKPSTFY